MEKTVVARKKEEVKKLTEKLKKAVSFYIVDYTGLNANDMNSLRRRFRHSKFEYFVIKNTILERASDKLGLEEVSKVLTGPNAISISYEDPIGPAKIFSDFYKENNLPTVKLCYIEGKWLSSDDVKKIAELPSKEVLFGQLLNLFSSPINRFVSLLRNTLSNFVRVLDEIKRVKEKETEEVKGEKQKEVEEVKGEKQKEVEEVKEEKQKEVEEVKEEKQEKKVNN